jgi:hypothetical protein
MTQFKTLLESELLNDETKSALKEAIESFKAEAITEAKNELEVEYAKKLLAEKEDIAKKMYALINEAVSDEISELKEDIAYYKDIEPKYAAKLEEFKVEYAQKLSESFEGLVENTVKAEITELHEDLMEAKINNFGMSLFEAFKTTYEKLGISDDMKTVIGKMETLKSELKESKDAVSKLEREQVMEGLLSNLNGGKREVMKTVLENVATDKLTERYEEVLDSVLSESTDSKGNDESENETITESEEAGASEDSSDELSRLRRLIK